MAGAVRAAGPDPRGAALCEEKGEGTQTERYPSGAVKIRVVCREGRGDAQVRYGWYFDERGRKVKEEDLVPDKPEMSRITETDYDLHATEVVGTRVYNGRGKLLESTGAAPGDPAAARAAAREQAKRTKASYTDYLTACQESPNDLLYPILGAEKEPQFFARTACACVAEKAVRADEAPLGKVWKKSKTLDPNRLKDRLAVAAIQNLGGCLCPQAFPESRLEKLCEHAAEIEAPWKP
jgi:hypothetical protein